MGWTAGVDHTASVVTVNEYNTYLGTSGSLNYLKAAVDAPMKAQLDSGSVVGGRGKYNFITGANVTLQVADNGGSDRIDVTIAASGSTLPTQGASSGVVTLTSAASTGVKGAWIQMIASTGFAVVEVAVSISAVANAKSLWDIGTGAAASEVVKIPDLGLLTQAVGDGISQVIQFSIPISTRVAMRFANADSGFSVTGYAAITVMG